jgi:hypothetical protein
MAEKASVLAAIFSARYWPLPCSADDVARAVTDAYDTLIVAGIRPMEALLAHACYRYVGRTQALLQVVANIWP